MELIKKQEVKKTDFGVVPIDWIELILGEHSEMFSGGTPNTSVKEYYSGNIPWISSSELNQQIINSTNGYISEKGLNNSSAKMVDENTFLLAMYGATAGVSAITKISGAINQAVLAIESKRITPHYLFYFFNFNKEKIILKYCQGGQPNLSGSIVKSISVPLPPTLEEQNSIATTLTDVDELIGGLEKLISKKKDIKQGLMQQLLTPPHKGGKRLPGFSGEWEKKQLKSCLTYEQPSKYIVQNSDYEGQSQTPVLTAGKSFLLGYTDEDFGVYDNLPVIIFDDFTTSSQFVNFNFKVKSSAMKMLKPVDNSVDIKFIFSLMNLINFSLGDEHKRRWIAEYSEQIIYVPKIDEQRAISSMIDDMTFELDELISKRKKYQAIKQGMMQELLTGKIRLV